MTATVTTLNGAQAEISDESLNAFRTTVRGDVLTANDDGYATVHPA